MNLKIFIILTIAGQEENLGAREFYYPPRAGELLQIAYQDEVLNLKVEQVRHRVDAHGHVSDLVCSRR